MFCRVQSVLDLQGMRAALLRCYSSLPSGALTVCPQQPQAWPRLLFVLAFFHALVLERRKYGSLGWNTKYDFSDGDWLCARQTLSMFLNTPVSLLHLVGIYELLALAASLYVAIGQGRLR